MFVDIACMKNVRNDDVIAKTINKEGKRIN